jgi:hypothetical protein
VWLGDLADQHPERVVEADPLERLHVGVED